MDLKLNQNAYHEDLQKGEAIMYRCPDGTHGLIFGCPRCGHVATGPHKYDPDTQTLKPSIVCNADGCGYHDFLNDGVFGGVD